MDGVREDYKRSLLLATAEPFISGTVVFIKVVENTNELASVYVCEHICTFSFIMNLTGAGTRIQLI